MQNNQQVFKRQKQSQLDIWKINKNFDGTNDSTENLLICKRNYSMTTEEIYKPIVDFGEAHAKAITNLTKAIANGDEISMKKYFDEAKYFEQQQQQAGIEARKYFLGKVHHG